MLDMNFIGWIVVGFIAGAISGALVGGGPRAAACRTSSSGSSAA